ncbi:MAG TPA: WYL domain-containing protein [Micrococcales bacterium]|uniref:YafY family transcriptional regulator n=1 Tax=Miniimonas arenae TaxID=676201 RepID=A0A5C5B800_9MICO|nr:YafY family protein [Miniimonas arenae]TNU73113.1 YafY family transcriptional regulator [Miniimonas arenae]HCX83637.1 WYL domain-containing protein [Micrococcales bacterium]
MAETTIERVNRLLAMVSYLAERDAVGVAEVARHFGVTEAQVLRDVETLWMSGTPGYQADDLIDFNGDAFDANTIVLTNARGMDRPLRLQPSEAVALIVALRALASLPGVEQTVVRSALEKLTMAAGEAVVAADAVSVAPGDTTVAEHVSGVLAVVRQALRDGARLHLTYAGASDQTTERDVDPLEISSDGEHWYVRAWCLRADDVRHFRLDRVVAVQPTGVPVAPDRPGTRTADSVRPSARPHSVRLELTPRSRWVAERFGGEVVAEGDGRITVMLAVADPAWLDRLVLDLGPDVLALDPPEHAARVAARARAALALYGARPDGGGS